MTLRDLEEMTFNLYMARDIINLKVTLTKLNYFFLLYTPDNKYDVC